MRLFLNTWNQTGQCDVLNHIDEGRFDPFFVSPAAVVSKTDRRCMTPSEKRKKDGCIKIVMHSHGHADAKR